MQTYYHVALVQLSLVSLHIFGCYTEECMLFSAAAGRKRGDLSLVCSILKYSRGFLFINATFESIFLGGSILLMLLTFDLLCIFLHLFDSPAFMNAVDF